MNATIAETFPWTYADLVGLTLHSAEGQLPGLIVVDRDNLDSSLQKELTRYQTDFRWCTKQDGETVCHIGPWASIDTAEVEAAVRAAIA